MRLALLIGLPASRYFQSKSLLSTNVGAEPKLPILRTLSNMSPFSQKSADSYVLSKLLRRDLRGLDVKIALRLFR
jgi:hypothetical protein